jgi:hypothetical protein
MISNLAYKRKLIERFIAQDPWDIEVIRSGRDSQNIPEPVVMSFVGRVHASGPYRGQETWSRRLTSDLSVGVGNQCLIGSYLAPVPIARDEVRATQRSSGLLKRFTVVYGSAYDHKIEAVMDESQ